MRTPSIASAIMLLVPLLVACPPENNDFPDMGPDPIEPVFPADISSWHQARGCRFSHEHELAYINVLVDAAAEEPYRELSPDFPYPIGATLVKPAYLDEDCTTITGYTAMQKISENTAPDGTGWRWQRLNADREVLEDGVIGSCITCHAHHCTPGQCGTPDCGYDLTCNEEL